MALYFPPLPLYKEMISNETRLKLVATYHTISGSGIPYVSGNSGTFPLRRQWHLTDKDLVQQVCDEISRTVGQYYLKFRPNPTTVRIYQSNYGTVKPHRDRHAYSMDPWTCLIYLTDDFSGGVLSVKAPRTATDIAEGGQPELRHKRWTPEPRTNYGIIFNKDMLHWTDEQYDGNKIIMLIDVDGE